MTTKQISSVLAIAVALTAAALPAQTPAANPELAGALAKEIGGTPQQAEGAAGALFGLAKTRLKPEDWSQVAAAVPGMDGLLKAAPAAPAAASGVGGALAGAVPGAAANLGGLASVAGAFKQLGLQPEMVTKAVPVLTSYVSKTGGADVGSLLAGALK